MTADQKKRGLTGFFFFKKKKRSGGSAETNETQVETNTKHTLKCLPLVEMELQKGTREEDVCEDTEVMKNLALTQDKDSSLNLINTMWRSSLL